MRSLRIGADIMGSDRSPSLLLDAIASLSLPKEVEISILATAEWKQKALQLGRFIEAKEVIQMEESPLTALRKKKEASLVIGMRLVKEKKIDAFVSAGNTGAMISSAKMILGTYSGIKRPALIALMPTKKRPVAVLDLGANVEAKAAHLVQFAYLGAAYQKARGIDFPKVGILNIGSEAVKGTAEMKAAYRLLEKAENPPFHFKGNIEGSAVFDGEVDVLVTDGFTGNIFLKTAEGLASLILDRFYSHIPKEVLQALETKFDDLQRHLHYAEHPGALLAGIKGTVIKCHGYSTPESFANAIKGASFLARGEFEQAFQTQVDKIFQKPLP